MASTFDFDSLVAVCQKTHEEMQYQAMRSVNRSLVVRNWLFGWYIVEYEQNGTDRAEYGARFIQTLSARLRQVGIKGGSRTRLQLYRSFYLNYRQISPKVSGELGSGAPLPPPLEICPTVSGEFAMLPYPGERFPEGMLGSLANAFALSWSHYVTLLTIDNLDERRFYEIEAIQNNWSVREVLAWFRKEAVRRQRLPESVLNDDDSVLIERLRLTEAEYLKRAATLLFHPDPQKFFTGAFVKIGYFKSDSDLRFHDTVEGDLFTQLDRTLDLLHTKYTHAAIEISGKGREETFPLPEPALREAVVNAIAHKDYSSGSPIQISVYDDKIMIWNDGQLPENWTVDDLLRKHASVPFNPAIASVFFLAGKIEAWGSGIERIVTACRSHGCPEPRFELQSIGLMTTLHFRPDHGGANQETTEKTTQETILALLRSEPAITRKILAQRLGITPDGVKYHLDKLRELGRIRHVGSTKKGRWEVTE